MPIIPVMYAFPNGLPATLHPGGAVIRVHVAGTADGDPVPDTGVLHVNTGNGFTPMPMIQVEGGFPDGTKLVTVHDPIRPGRETPAEGAVTPGELFPAEGEIELNAGRPKTALKVVNTGDRPIQVGSHYHFFETNKALEFDRAAAYGLHLDIPAGTAVRFEPGESREVTLTAFGGTGELFGLNSLTDGSAHSEARKAAALRRARDQGFRGA